MSDSQATTVKIEDATREQLMRQTAKDLRQLIRDKKLSSRIKGFSTMKKPQLVTKILAQFKKQKGAKGVKRAEAKEERGLRRAEAQRKRKQPVKPFGPVPTRGGPKGRGAREARAGPVRARPPVEFVEEFDLPKPRGPTVEILDDDEPRGPAVEILDDGGDSKSFISPSEFLSRLPKAGKFLAPRIALGALAGTLYNRYGRYPRVFSNVTDLVMRGLRNADQRARFLELLGQQQNETIEAQQDLIEALRELRPSEAREVEPDTIRRFIEGGREFGVPPARMGSIAEQFDLSDIEQSRLSQELVHELITDLTRESQADVRDILEERAFKKRITEAQKRARLPPSKKLRAIESGRMMATPEERESLRRRVAKQTRGRRRK